MANNVQAPSTTQPKQPETQVSDKINPTAQQQKEFEDALKKQKLEKKQSNKNSPNAEADELAIADTSSLLKDQSIIQKDIKNKTNDSAKSAGEEGALLTMKPDIKSAEKKDIHLSTPKIEEELVTAETKSNNIGLEPKTPGEKILANLNNSDKVNTASPLKELNNTIERIIDQIKVGINQLNSKKEVHLTLADPNFKGTEVKLVLEGQRLQVTFSGQADQLEWLQHNQLNLQQRLQRLNANQEVELSFMSFQGDSESEQGQEQRSKQYQDALDNWQEGHA